MPDRREFLKGLLAAASAPLLPARLRAEYSRLNLIEIVADTWATHWMGCYGAQNVRTPNIDALAAKSVKFLDAYPEGLPTLPARRVLYTGRRVFPGDLYLQRDDPSMFRAWHQLYLEDVSMAETLRDAGYTTALVTDLFHQFKPGRNFHRGFAAWRQVRGQEMDAFETGPTRDIDVTNFVHPSQSGSPPPAIARYLANRRRWKTEEDWPASQLAREACQWLEDNLEDNQPFYLQIECYSPHEAWDPPEDYYRMYMKSDYDGPRLIFPPQSAPPVTPLEAEHIRALYAGMVTFTDSRIGRVLDKVNELGLMESTVIVFVGGHGALMGEKGQFRNAEGTLRTQVTHVPLLVYDPPTRATPRGLKGFVQHTDVLPTALDLLGVPIPSRATGTSRREMVESGASSTTGHVITGWNDHGSVRTPEWLYVGRWGQDEGDEELYDLKKDPFELADVLQQNRAVARDLRAKLVGYVEESRQYTQGSFCREVEPAPEQ